MVVINKNWAGKVLYQIYPRSFKDSNNDGIGDLRGIISKLEYLKGKPSSLGVDIIWISPFYPSPMVDFGYDIKNYINIDKIFGNLEDFKAILNKAHGLGLKIMVDFVPNHTSIEHPWFKDSRSSKDAAKRDWYVWQDPKNDGSLPNNWQSVFGGSAWQYDEKTKQFYLHSFHKKQPDLNWSNNQVVKEMQKVLRFWLDLGVDGFRVDAISWISKDSKQRNDKQKDQSNLIINTYDSLLHDKSMHYHQLFKRINIINQTVKQYDDKFVVYEYYDKPSSNDPYKLFYDNTDSSICAPFNFSLINQPWEFSNVKNCIDNFFKTFDQQQIAVFCLGNHDTIRLVDRIGERAAKQAAVILLSLPGIPTIYYGDELGMHGEYVASKNIKDPFEKQQPGKNLGRDPNRAPMHWNTTANNGFSEHNAWLKSYESYPCQAYSTELNNPKSYFNIYRNLISLRKKYDTLMYGSYKKLDLHKKIFGYYRQFDNEKILILNNFETQKNTFVDLYDIKGRIIFSTHSSHHHPVNGYVNLKKNESLIIKII